MALDKAELACFAQTFERHADFVVGQKWVRSPPEANKPGSYTFTSTQGGRLPSSFRQSIQPLKIAGAQLSYL
jgi:hypothetical protein